MKHIKRITAIVLVLILLVSTGAFSIEASAHKAGDSVKGKTVCQALGMDGAAYMNWLLSHEHDNYYLGTPYRAYDHRNPRGDCKGAYGTLDQRGVPGMNCMGFVWHVLYKATKMSGGNTKKVRAMAAGRLTFYEGYNITRRYFRNKKAMLDSGYLEKGDIIWMIPGQNEYMSTVYHHVGIYWGDGHSDKLWHSNTVTGGQGRANVISKIYPMLDQNTMYIVLKVGAVSLDAPQLTSANNSESGIKVSWNKVDGAKKYRVFLKSGSKWKKLGDTTKTSYIYKDAVDGQKYTFTVRCVTSCSKGFTSFYNKKGISCVRLSAPKVAAQNTAEGVMLSWNAKKGAATYRIYQKEDGDYQRIAITTDTAYLDTAVEGGGRYTYAVRAVRSDGTLGAYHIEGCPVTFIAPPAVEAQATDVGVALCWELPEGAESSFRVFIKDGDSWRLLRDVTETSYLDTSAVTPGVYTYAVRCLSGDGSYFTSGYLPVSVTIVYQEM